MKRRMTLWVAVFLGGMALSLAAQDAVPRPGYTLSWKKEVPLVLGGLGLWVGAKWAGDHGTPLDPSMLNRQDVFSWERWVIDCHNRNATRISDATLRLSLLGGAVLALASGQGEERITDFCLWSETLLWSAGLTYMVKDWVRRPRPSAYRKAETGEPLTPESARSFFSGHTSLAFASAVSALSIYSHRRGDSSTAWVLGLSTATVCGLCRIWGGHHFPSDVTVGAAVGALLGWAIPRWHENGNSIQSVPGSQITLQFTF